MRIFVAYIAAFLVVAGAVLAAIPQPAMAAGFNPFDTCGAECNTLNDNTLGAKAKNIINTALLLLGGVAMIMVVVGGLRMTASHGDPSQFKAGRETVLYSLVGVIVAVSAAAIVNFVISFKW